MPQLFRGSRDWHSTMHSFRAKGSLSRSLARAAAGRDITKDQDQSLMVAVYDKKPVPVRMGEGDRRPIIFFRLVMSTELGRFHPTRRKAKVTVRQGAHLKGHRDKGEKVHEGPQISADIFLPPTLRDNTL